MDVTTQALTNILAALIQAFDVALRQGGLVMLIVIWFCWNSVRRRK